MNETPHSPGIGQHESPWTESLDAMVPLRVEGFQFTQANESIVVHGPDGVLVTSLNDIAAMVLALCDGARPLGEIRRDLLATFPDQSGQIDKDLIELLAQLNRHHLVVLCGAPVVPSQSPYGYMPGTFHNNRGELIARILEGWGWRRATGDRVAELAVWHPGDQGFRIAKHQSHEPFQTLEVRCKRRLYLNLAAAGSSHIMPETHVSAAGFRASKGTDGDLWFLKLSSSTMSRGVTCYRSNHEVLAAATAMEPQVYVIQRGVEDPVLVDGRKFTLRVYVTMVSGKVYVHEKALVLLQSAAYDESSTDSGVQIIDPSRCQRLSSDRLPCFNDHFDQIAEAAASTFGAVQSVFSRVADPHRFQVFGLDFLISRSQGALLLEVNDWPDLSSSATSALDVERNALKTLLLTDTFRLVLEGSPGLYQRVLQ